MEVSNARARIELIANATPTSTNVQNDVAIGHPLEVIQFPDADVAYSVRAIIAPSSDFVLNVADGVTSGSDAWVAGEAQVETATAVGTISGTGNATVTVTADDMDNSPKAISVAVVSGDTAAVWAGKVRTALAADIDVAATFGVTGSGAEIILFRVPKLYGGLIFYVVNDATINIALDNGTCTGITPAATSDNTTEGVATSGCVIYDGDGKDFEGVTIPTIATMKAILMEAVHGSIGYESSSFSSLGTLVAGEIPTLTANPLLFGELTFTSEAPAEIKITVIGQTS